MWLIDADALGTIQSIQSADFNSIETIREWIYRQPTIDAVPVVRCRDCVFFSNTKPGQPNILCFQMHEDDYCSYGEREDKN